MLKPASSLCNLRCRYCFYHDVAQSREQASFGIMELSTAKKLIASALSFADGRQIAFSFQGGEPLLAGKDWFRAFCAYVKKKNYKNSPIYYGLQTNGTLIDDEWASLFAENGFLVGLSLDGDFDDNAFRLDSEGKNPFFSILAGAQCLQRHGVEFNILSVLTGKSADNIDKIYRFFRSKGFRYLQFIPCLRPFGDKSEGELFMTTEQYTHFLIHAFNLYVKDYVRNQYISIRQFDNWVRLFLGQKSEQCGMGGHCTHQFVVEGNGNVYPCDFYCTDEYLLGNINNSSLEFLAKSPRAESFLRESLSLDFRCRSCKYLPLCRGGGCKRQRADRDYCKSYRAFFSACLPLFSVFKYEK